MKTGFIFGFGSDWLSQHLPIAESLRQTMLESGRLLPRYINLGGGSSAYDFAYYGLLRPDILLRCLLPGVGMEYILGGYAIFELLLGVTLMYLWLKGNCQQNAIGKRAALAGSVLYPAAGCETPAEISGSAGAEKPSRRENLNMHGRFLFWILLSVGLAAVLLLPTGLDILSTAKDGGVFAGSKMPLVNLKLSGLLCSPYGMGLTMIGLYALLCALEKRCLRLPAGAVLAASLFPVIPFALNGFLHARGKILIPFLLLVCLIFARLLEEYFVGKDVPKVWAGMICLIPCIALKGKYGMWQYADWGILMLWILLVRQGYRLRRPRLEKTRCTQRLTAALLLVPCIFSFCLNTEMGFVSRSQIKTEAIRKAFDEASALMNENRRGNAGNYRFEILTDAFNLCNFLPGAEAKRSSMYSSITQQDYAKFFYDGAKNSIPIQNRVALISRENALFNYKMGVRYILTDKDSIPKGYRKISESGKAARGGGTERYEPFCPGVSTKSARHLQGLIRLTERGISG